MAVAISPREQHVLAAIEHKSANHDFATWQYIARTVWGSEDAGGDLVRVYIRSLRKKGIPIKNIPWHGYYLSELDGGMFSYCPTCGQVMQVLPT